MRSFTREQELDSVISKTTAQANALRSTLRRGVDVASEAAKLNRSVRDAQRLLAFAGKSLKLKETQLQRQGETCLSLCQATKRAKVTIENICSYTISRRSSQNSKISFVLHESPSEYLKSIVQTYEEELVYCETVLNDMQCAMLPSETEVKKQESTVHLLTGATGSLVSVLLSRITRLA